VLGRKVAEYAVNIFYVDTDPVLAAKSLCDKHIVKMPLETAQMLCVPFVSAPYKPTHTKHPCTLWALSSLENYNWLLEHGVALSHEYTARYGRVHASEEVIWWCYEGLPALGLPSLGLQVPALAMPDRFKCDDPVESYRAYYMGAKVDLAKWEHGNPPYWWNPYAYL
jgi:hypothetical protein